MFENQKQVCYKARHDTGEVAEWFKAAVLKTAVVNSYREFESHPLRQKFKHLRQFVSAFFITCCTDVAPFSFFGVNVVQLVQKLVKTEPLASQEQHRVSF